ncbi:phage tail protein [Chitinimonas naiadis]
MSEDAKRAMDFATLLYRQLPAIYRERDQAVEDTSGELQPGALAQVLADYGDLLDALYRTLMQRYYDIFPETEGTDAEGLARGCQSWVLPYLAQLLDVQLMSPLEQGRREEIGHAVAWRQRKGTPQAIEDIADAVAGMEVEIREGWREVAVTPHAGFTLLRADVFGEPNPGLFGDPDKDYDPRYPDRRAEHPGLPNGTVDLRRASRAIRTNANNPAGKPTTFSGELVYWRQSWPHGAPCFPGSFQDVSGHTADLRTPDWRRGHAHPRRVILHAPPFPGFFSPQPASVQWSTIADAVKDGTTLGFGLPLGLEKRIDDEGEYWHLYGKTAAPVRIRGVVELDLPKRWSFERLWFDNKLEIWQGRARFESCALRQLHIHKTDSPLPVAIARNSLFKQMLAPLCLVELEYVTILERLVAEKLQASDCLFLKQPRKDLVGFDVPGDGCVRYSRFEYFPPPEPQLGDPPIPPAFDWLAQGVRSKLKVHKNSCSLLAPIFWSETFGDPGCAVLHPQSDDRLRFGAEDGGEMGACHALAYTLREQAVIQKLRDTLPVGIEAVLAPDASLVCAPPLPK